MPSQPSLQASQLQSQTRCFTRLRAVEHCRPGHREVILHLTRLPVPNFECPQSTKRHTKFFCKLTWIYQILDRKVDMGNFRSLFVRAVRPLLLFSSAGIGTSHVRLFGVRAIKAPHVVA